MFALTVALFLVGGVLAVDIGLLYDSKARAQAAVDFAALAAAQDLPQSASDPDFEDKLAAAEQTAEEYLISNGFDPADADIDAQISTQYDGAADKILVSVSLEQPWLFARLFGRDTMTVGARAVGQTNAIPRDIVVVLDRSGSMCHASHGSGVGGDCPDPGRSRFNRDYDGNGVYDWQPFDTMREAALGFSTYFRPELEGVTFDRLALVTYSSDVTRDMSLSNDFVGAYSEYAREIEDMEPDNNTNIGGAIERAKQELDANARDGADKVIVLLTDGIANVCSWGDCAEWRAEEYARNEAEDAAAEGYRIFTIGLTEGAGDDLLQEIAETGDGQFFDVDDPQLLEQAFAQIAELLAVTLVE